VKGSENGEIVRERGRVSQDECHWKPNDFTIELKEKSRALKLSSTGNKAELISRLVEADPLKIWMRDVSEASGTNAANQEVLPPNADQREIELCRREKELTERELTLARAELRLLQEIQRLSVSKRKQRDPVAVLIRLSIIKIAYLLSQWRH